MVVDRTAYEGKGIDKLGRFICAWVKYSWSDPAPTYHENTNILPHQNYPLYTVRNYIYPCHIYAAVTYTANIIIIEE